MNHAYKSTVAVAGLFAMLAVAGCSGGPSSGDIEKAVQLSQTRSAEQMKQWGGAGAGSNMLPKIHEVKKLGCTADQSGAGYQCDVEMDVTPGMGGTRTKGVTKMRLVRGSDGWMLTR